jgi:hypothetical protein
VFTPAAFSNLPYRSTSERMMALNCSGVLPTGIAPSFSQRVRTSGHDRCDIVADLSDEDISGEWEIRTHSCS